MNRKVAAEHFDISLTRQKFNPVEAKDPRNNWNPKKPRMKRIVNFITDTFSGENKAGEALHGIFDLLPFPNQVIAKTFAYLKSGDTWKAREEASKLFTFRNFIAMLAFFAIITGVLTIEDVEKLLRLFSVVG